MIYKDITEEIEKLRKELHDCIEKSGINSSEAKKVSEQIDELISNCYQNRRRQDIIQYEYNLAYEKIKQLTREFGEFPSTQGWDKYAKEHIFLSHVSIEYLSELNWNELRVKIKSEIKKNKCQ